MIAYFVQFAGIYGQDLRSRDPDKKGAGPTPPSTTCRAAFRQSEVNRPWHPGRGGETSLSPKGSQKSPAPATMIRVGEAGSEKQPGAGPTPPATDSQVPLSSGENLGGPETSVTRSGEPPSPNSGAPSLSIPDGLREVNRPNVLPAELPIGVEDGIIRSRPTARTGSNAPTLRRWRPLDRLKHGRQD